MHTEGDMYEWQKRGEIAGTCRVGGVETPRSNTELGARSLGILRVNSQASSKRMWSWNQQTCCEHINDRRENMIAAWAAACGCSARQTTSEEQHACGRELRCCSCRSTDSGAKTDLACINGRCTESRAHNTAQKQHSWRGGGNRWTHIQGAGAWCAQHARKEMKAHIISLQINVDYI